MAMTIKRKKEVFGKLLIAASLISISGGLHAQTIGQGNVAVKSDDLIKDSGFESGNIDAYKRGSNGQISTTAYSGTYAAKIPNQNNVGSAAISQEVALEAGQTYTGVVMAKVSSASKPVIFVASQSPNGEDVSTTSSNTNWQSLSVDFTGSYSNSGKAYIYCTIVSPGTAAAYCDDMHVYKVTPMTVKDSGFESGGLTNWEFSSGAEATSATSHSGKYSVKLSSGAYTWASKGMTIKPNTSYIATAWVKTTGNGSVALQASLTNSTGWYSTSALKSSDWVKATLTFTSASNDTDLHLYCGNSDTSGVTYCDDFQLRELASNVVSGSTTINTAAQSFESGFLKVGLDSKGYVVNLIDTRSNINYAKTDKQAPLLSFRIGGSISNPTAVTTDAADSSTLIFSNTDAGWSARVKVDKKDGYSKLTLTSYSAPSTSDVQMVIWGPLTTTINQIVGDAVGNVRERDFTIGIKVLNAKTEAGRPNELDDVLWHGDIEHPIYLQTYPGWPYYGAQKTSWGSMLSAFTMDYTKERKRKGWWPNYPDFGLPVDTREIIVDKDNDNGDLYYSTIALYGADTNNVMTTLSHIAKTEGLPYLTLNGQWGKVSQSQTDSHLVYFDLRQDNLDTAVSVANSMGINRIYSLPSGNGPWASGGSYVFNSDFGSSDSAAKAMADKAAKSKVKIGVHTLSDFIDTWDPLVTSSPPNAGLATGPRGKLTRALDATSTELYVNADSNLADPKFRLNRLRIDNELVEFTASEQVGSELKITGIKRGAFGSTAVSHSKDALVKNLISNEYGGLSATLTLQESIGKRIADLYNNAGIKYHSFDGLEDTGFTGYGGRGFAYHVNRGFVGNLANKDDVIVEASQVNTGIWDAISRISWGEVGRTTAEQRERNRGFYKVNLMPNMMGWISFDKDRTQADINRLMAEAAGANAGIGFQTWVANVGDTTWTKWKDYFATVKRWETARKFSAFNPWQRAELMDLSANWNLTDEVAGSKWKLQLNDEAGNAVGTATTVSKITPTLSNIGLPNAKKGKFYQTQIRSNTVLTQAFTVSFGLLPPSISLNADTGGLFGTPTKIGTWEFTIQAKNGDLSNASYKYMLTVSE